jgi:hypothetical protein
MRSSILVCIGALVMSLGVTAAPAPKEEGNFHLPVDSKDGLYVHSTDEKGAMTLEYLGTFNDSGYDPGLVKRADEGPRCLGGTIDSRSWDGAIDGFIAMCRFQNPARFTSSIMYKSGSAVAYGCNYGKGQECGGDHVNNFFTSLKSTCGNDQRSYYNVPKWKATYGVTNSGTSYC